jgi:hypothetical protein
MSTQSQELQVYSGGAGTSIQLVRDPEKEIQESIDVSKKLKKIVSDMKWALKIGESEHLKNEAWQTLASFFGLAPRIRESNYVDLGGVKGFKSTAELVEIASGRIVSTADAFCGDDEERWSSRPKYESLYVCKDGTRCKEDPGKGKIEWEPNPKVPGKKRPKRERRQVGEEKVPLAQILSMSETRASSKVCGMVLKKIVVLAGYAPTAAEEIDPTAGGDDYESEDEDAGIQQPKSTGSAQANHGSTMPADKAAGKFISQDQINKIWGAGYAANQFHKSLEKIDIETVIRQCGYPRSDQIPADQFERVYKSVLQNQVLEAEPGPGVGVKA